MNVILADDALLFREGLARLLGDAGFTVTGQAAAPETLLDLVDAGPPDLAIVDIRMPPTHTSEGLLAALAIRSRHPDVAILVLSQYVETNHAVRLIGERASGVGYLLKDRVSELDDFVDSVWRVAKGGSVIDPEVISLLVGRGEHGPLRDLTAREREVLALMAEGRSNASICQKLGLSPKTVDTHVANIFGKLGLEPEPDDHRRVLAVLTWLRGR